MPFPPADPRVDRLLREILALSPRTGSEAPPQTIQTRVGSRLAARLFSMVPMARGLDISGGPRKR